MDQPAATVGTIATETGFVRKASGLVRGFSVLDNWIYNVIAISPIITGSSVSFFFLTGLYPRASLWLALLIAGLFCVFEAIAYSCFVAVMPRSGGDYVFQSRVLGGAFATIFAFTNSVLAQIFFMGIAGWIAATQILAPFFLLLGAEQDISAFTDFAGWLGTDVGWFVCGLVCLAFACWINAAGVRLYAMVQRYTFWIAMACVAIAVVMFLFTSKADFVANFNAFMGDHYGVQDAYGTVLGNAGPVDTSFSLGDTLKATVIASLSLIYPAWGVQQAGEVRRADSLRANMRAMVGAEVFSVALLIVLGVLMVSRIGTDFLWASQQNFGTDQNPIPVFPFFGFLVAVAGNGGIFVWVAFVMFFLSFLMLFPNAALGATRTTMAMSFDRVLPEWFGRVHGRYHTPVNALAVFCTLGVGASALYSYNSDFKTLTLAMIVPSVAAFGVTMLAAIALPIRRKEMYEAAPAARYRIAGVPVMSVCAGIFLVFVLWVIYRCLTRDELGINGNRGLVFIGILYGAAALTYGISRVYRRRTSSFDLDVVFSELPVE